MPTGRGALAVVLLIAAVLITTLAALLVPIVRGLVTSSPVPPASLLPPLPDATQVIGDESVDRGVDNDGNGSQRILTLKAQNLTADQLQAEMITRFEAAGWRQESAPGGSRLVAPATVHSWTAYVETNGEIVEVQLYDADPP